MVSLDLKINESKVKSTKWKLAIEHTGKGLPTHIFEGKKSKQKSVEKEKELTAKQKQTSRQQEKGQKKIEEARKRKKGKKFKIRSETYTTETKAKARRKKKQESRNIAQSYQLKKNEQSQESSDHVKRKQSGIPQKSNAVKANKKKTKKRNKSKQNPSTSESEQGQNPTKTKLTGSPATAPEHKKGKKNPLSKEHHAEEKTLPDTHSCNKKKRPPKKRKITEEAETQSNSVKEQPAKKRKTENVKKLGNSPQLSKPVTVKRINQTKPLKKTTLTTDLQLKGGVSKYEKAVGATALAVYSRRENEKQLLREAFAKNACK